MGSKKVYYLSLSPDTVGAGIEVKLTVAVLGRVCGSVLGKLGRWDGRELVELQSGRGGAWPGEPWSNTCFLSLTPLPRADCGRCAVLVLVALGGEETVLYAN